MNAYLLIIALSALITSYLVYDSVTFQSICQYLLTGNEQRDIQHEISNNFSENDTLLLLKKWESTIYIEKMSFKDVLIGLNANLDLIIATSTFFHSNNILFSDTTHELNHINLGNVKELKEAVSYHMKKGIAGERFLSDKILFGQLVSKGLNSNEKEVAVGGNAALIAQTMRTLYPENVQLTLVAPVGPRLKKLLHKNISIPQECQDSNDEVHVILEYSEGSQLCPQCAKAPVANRFIFSHDESNAHLTKLDMLIDLSKKADLVVISGLHLTEFLPAPDWNIILKKLHHGLKESSAFSHLELASMTDPFRLNDIANQVLPVVYSLGLNEQELQFLSQSYAGPHVTLTSSESSQPEVSKVVDTLEWLLTNKTDTKLSRIHFHSLTYHIIAVRVNKQNHKVLTLPSLASAVAAAAMKAGVRACDIPIPDPTMQNIKLESRIVRLGSSGPHHHFHTQNIDSWIVTWKSSCEMCKEDEKEIRFALSPVLVCKNPVKTVGLGDSISATGLLHTPKFL